MRDSLKNLKIGVLMGGRSAERDISLKTGDSVLKSLKDSGYNAFGFDLDDNFINNIGKIDVCFIALHGTYGEDGRVQGVLELYGVPYTGSGLLASAIAMDKLKSRIIFEHYGINTPVFIQADKHDDPENVIRRLESIEPPYFIKPNSSGSSLGCYIVNSMEELAPALNNAFEYDDKLLIEKYISGREIQFAVSSGEPLGCVEIKPKDSFYSFEAKYTKGKTEYLVNPDLSAEEYEACVNASVKAHKCLDCSGITRVDIILKDSNNAVVLEINTLPGLTELSLVPMIAKSKGISFNELIENIIEDAISKEKAGKNG